MTYRTDLSTHRTGFPSDTVRIDGALDLEKTEQGLRPARLPAWARAQVPDAFFELGVQSCAGVRLVLRTAATALALTLHTTRVAFAGSEPVPAAVDLVVDGAFSRREAVTAGDVVQLLAGDGGTETVPGPPETLHFTGLPAGEKEVEIWLPQTAGCALVSLEADAPVESAGPSGRPRWVHYGSSISHCLEAEGPTGMWPAVAAAVSGLHLTNLAFAGNAMLDPFVARTIRDLPADLITLKIGVNIVIDDSMRGRTFLPAVHGFLDTIREGHPDTPVTVISPIPAPQFEHHPGPGAGAPRTDADPAYVPPETLTLSSVRGHLERVVRERRKSDPALGYLDGRTLLHPDETEDLPDGLHPSAAAYLRMGTRFADTLASLRSANGAQ